MMKKCFVFMMISSVIVLSGCSRNQYLADVEYDQSVSPYHIVRPGDTIGSLSRRYNMDRSELIRLNGLKPPYRIVVGQRLLVRVFAKTKKTDIVPVGEPINKGGVEVQTLRPLPGADGTKTNLTVPGETLDPTLRADDDVDEGGEALGGATNKEGGFKAPDSVEKTAKISIPASDRVFRRPLAGKIVVPFQKGRDGINIAAPMGTPVVAANNGVVAHAGNKVKGFGNIVLVKHDNGMITVYAHLNEIKVKSGDKIVSGQKLGTVGKTGDVSEPQLHFELRKGKVAVDPEEYFKG